MPKRTNNSNGVYLAIVRFLFLKYLWVHFLVVTVVPLVLVGDILDESITMFVVLWFGLSIFFTWLLSRWSPVDAWYNRNVPELAGRRHKEQRPLPRNS